MVSFKNPPKKTTWVATQFVCSLAEPYTQEKRSVRSVVFHSLKFFSFDVRIQRGHDVAVRDGEVCVSARGGWKRRMRGPVRDVQEESGSEWKFVSRTDLAGRHDTQRETPQHDRACRATTPKNMTARASNGTQAHGTRRHTSTRHATALHAMVWLHISYHARHCRDTSVAGAGRRNAHTELSLSRGCLGVDTAGFAAV